MATMKKTTKKPAKGGATKPSMLNRIYTSFDQVTDAYNGVRDQYATDSTREDFAETFMLFVKHKGKIPAQFKGKPVIAKKWKAVAEIVKRVAMATRYDHH